MPKNTRNPLDPRTLENPFQHLPVLDSLATPPSSPNDGDRYRVIATATGEWIGQENRIAVYNILNESWIFEKLGEGAVIYDLQNDDYHKVNNVGDFTEFDKFPISISDVASLQSTLDGKASSPIAIGDVTNLQSTLDSKEPLLPSKTGNADKFLKVNVTEDGFEFAEGGGGIDPNSVGNTEISAHTSTKITITAKGQLNNQIVYLDATNEPATDNTGIIGTTTKRLASVRAVLIQSGDIILSDKKTGKPLYVIDEDKDGITFKTIRGKKMMRILRNGNLLVRGKLIEGAKF